MPSEKSSDRHKKAADSTSGYYYYDEGSSYSGYGYGYGGEGGQSPQKGIKDYLLVLRERIWYVLIGFLLVFSLAVVVTINQTEVYRATSTVEILRREARIIDITGPTGTEPEIRSTEDFNTQVQILSSASMAGRVASRITGEERTRFMRPYEKGGAGDPLSPDAVLMRNREISPLRMSLIVAISYSHPDREIAARVANYFAEEFIDHNLRQRIQDSMKAVEDLRVRAEQQRLKVEEVENLLQNYREESGTVSFDQTRDVSTEKLRSINQMATQMEQAFSETETIYLTLQRFREEGRRLTDFSHIASQPLVAQLIAQRSDKRIQVANLAERYRDLHPLMIQVRQSLEQTEQELQGSIDSAVAKLETEYRSQRRNLDQIQDARLAQEQDLLAIRRLAVEFEAIQRESEVQQSIYKYLVGRMRDTTIAGGIESPTSRVIDSAGPPMRPVVPNIPMNLAMGILGGLGLGFGVAFFVAFIDDRVKTAFDIENVLGLTLLGIIPEIKKLTPAKKAKVVLNEEDRQVVEAFRTLHSSLKLNNESKFAQSILITSSLPGEGKSFTSTNLALTFAAHGERTLIIDCDLRMPNIHKSLELENKKGMIDICVHEAQFDDVVQKDAFTNCDILTTGGRAKNPTQILSSKNFERLVAEVRKRYDRIIFDTPPLAAVSDALIVLPLVDGVVFTIKFNKVKRNAAKHNSRRLLESNVPVFGAVLNNLSLSVSGYYYAQYYDKSYYDYYSPNSKKAAGEGPLRG